MSSILPRTLRLLKLGAVAGALIGVGRLVLMRRRRSEVDESTWPTIAETAARNGEPVDDEAAPAEADASDEDASGEETEGES